jgi:hypothetical protein
MAVSRGGSAHRTRVGIEHCTNLQDSNVSNSCSSFFTVKYYTMKKAKRQKIREKTNGRGTRKRNQKK